MSSDCNNETDQTHTSLDREVVNRRDFPVPREAVFEAFSDLDQLVGWWGPKGFKNTFLTFDFRPGGMWRYEMCDPDGETTVHKSLFVDIRKPDRIVIRHLEPFHEFHLTVTLTSNEEKTELQWHMLFETAAECERVKPFVAVANEENLDRLEAHLANRL